MPEGHVIHRIARKFQATFRNAPLAVSSPQGRFHREAALLDGAHLERAEAFGKHLFLVFDDSAIVHIHLGLIGSLRFAPLAEPRGQVRLRVSNGKEAADLRGPQRCRLIDAQERERVIDTLGPDPLRDDDPAAALAAAGRSRRAIGSLLMDQSLFAGVGSIYRTESLFRRGINPRQPGNQLSVDERRGLWDDLVENMRRGLETGRIDTVRPEHTPEAMGREPRVDEHGGEVYVYRRAGMPCLVCGERVREGAIDGRKAFWCPRCQPMRGRTPR